MPTTSATTAIGLAAGAAVAAAAAVGALGWLLGSAAKDSACALSAEAESFEEAVAITRGGWAVPPSRKQVRRQLLVRILHRPEPLCGNARCLRPHAKLQVSYIAETKSGRTQRGFLADVLLDDSGVPVLRLKGPDVDPLRPGYTKHATVMLDHLSLHDVECAVREEYSELGQYVAGWNDCHTFVNTVCKRLKKTERQHREKDERKWQLVGGCGLSHGQHPTIVVAAEPVTPTATPFESIDSSIQSNWEQVGSLHSARLSESQWSPQVGTAMPASPKIEILESPRQITAVGPSRRLVLAAWLQVWRATVIVRRTRWQLLAAGLRRQQRSPRVAAGPPPRRPPRALPVVARPSLTSHVALGRYIAAVRYRVLSPAEAETAAAERRREFLAATPSGGGSVRPVSGAPLVPPPVRLEPASGWPTVCCDGQWSEAAAVLTRPRPPPRNLATLLCHRESAATAMCRRL